MKLRLTHNSIRIRIRKSELDTLKSHRSLVESIELPGEIKLRFGLSINTESKDISVSFSQNHLNISLPSSLSDQWINSDQVGITKDLSIANKDKLQLLIEKDFPCIDRPNEDKSDTFWELAEKNVENC